MALSKVDPNFLNVSQIGGRRNLIINGAMQVAQRGTSATGKTQSGYYCSDRFQVYFNNLGEMTATVSQDSNAPDGFSNSHKVLVTTPESASYSTTELHCGAWYKFEGQDLQHLQYGTSGAKDLTLSFWVKSNVTGTYTASFYKTTGGSKVVVPTYTIDTADTWEYKTVTVSGDTAVAFANNNSNELDIYFNTAVGPGYTSGSAATTWSSYITTNWAVGHTAQFGLSANDYWQITGVQLEVGDTATPFEHRSYGEELSLCQRYYCHSYREGHYPASTTNSSTPIGETSPGSNSYHSLGQFYFPVQMRAVPTITIYNPVTGTVGSFQGDSNSYSGAVSHSFTEKGVRFYANGTGASTNVFCSIQAEADAEL